MASSDPNNSSNLTRGLIGRRGTPSGKGGRLPSIRAPRDLTLGGVPKKTFVPNLNARNRDKSKDEQANTTSPNFNSRKQNRGRDDKRGRGRGRGKPEVIQSHSIFEDGPAYQEGRNNRAAGEGGGGASGGGGGGSVGGGGGGRFGHTKSAAEKRLLKREVKEEETRRILDTILKDDFIDDEPEDVDKFLIPVKLPLHSSVVKPEAKAEVACFDGVKIKKEVTDETDSPQPSGSRKDKAASTIETITGAKDITPAKIFANDVKSEPGEILFFQLPDALPGNPPTPAVDDKKNEKPVTPSSSQSDTGLEKELAKCSLTEFPEGLIGKIQVLKSGRVRMVIGTDIVLNIAAGTPCSFLQDVVAVHLDQKKESGDMTVLGELTHKVVCSPDFEHLLGLS